MKTKSSIWKRCSAIAGATAAAAAAVIGLCLVSRPVGAKAPVPAEVVGTWGFTTISGTTYWDKSTGAYLGSGSGGSQSYTFSKNGRYKLFNYVKTSSYGWEMQALTWEEGTASFNGSQVTLRPASGRYQVMDNRVKKNNYKRPMRPAERKTKTYTWSLDTDSRTGKPALMMGKDSSSLSSYVRAD